MSVGVLGDVWGEPDDMALSVATPGSRSGRGWAAMLMALTLYRHGHGHITHVSSRGVEILRDSGHIVSDRSIYTNMLYFICTTIQVHYSNILVVLLHVVLLLVVHLVVLCGRSVALFLG